MKKHIIYLFLLSFILFSCNDKEENGTISPVTNLSVTPNIGSVILNWSNPEDPDRSAEHTSELQSPLINTYVVICLKKKKINSTN